MYYLSKLQEFENFLATTSKFPALSLSSPPSKNNNNNSQKPIPGIETNPSQTSLPQKPQKSAKSAKPAKSNTTKLLLIEDLPLASNFENQSKLQSALRRLAAGAQFLTVVIISDSIQQENGKVGQGWSHVANCLEALEEGGAKKVRNKNNTPMAWSGISFNLYIKATPQPHLNPTFHSPFLFSP